ncbi:MAG: peptide deformylase, partial [Actinomycetota bacterium]|nr:peptide deformylase [Actinomycetota bacterium]
IRRAANVVVAGLSIRGEDVLIEARGFEARVLQHELDHLDGVLILDRVESLADLSPRTQPFQQLPSDEDPADVAWLPVDLNATGSTAKGRRRA